MNLVIYVVCRTQKHGRADIAVDLPEAPPLDNTGEQSTRHDAALRRGRDAYAARFGVHADSVDVIGSF